MNAYGLSKLYELQVRNNTILAMTKILGVCYAVYYFTFITALLTKGRYLREIFDCLQQTSKMMYEAGCRFPPEFKVGFHSLLLN